MSIESDLYQTLRSLVADRVYPLTFPQIQNPTWPAMRYTFVSAETFPALCGDGGDPESTYTIQVDIVATTYQQARSLRLSVLTAMADFDPPTTWNGEFEAFDAETKTYRVTLDFQVHPSST